MNQILGAVLISIIFLLLIDFVYVIHHLNSYLWYVGNLLDLDSLSLSVCLTHSFSVSVSLSLLIFLLLTLSLSLSFSLSMSLTFSLSYSLSLSLSLSQLLYLYSERMQRQCLVTLGMCLSGVPISLFREVEPLYPCSSGQTR